MPDNDVIIRAENIGKRYVLNHQTGGSGYRKFSDVLVHAAQAPLRWLRRPTPNRPSSIFPKEDFWALRTSTLRSNVAKSWHHRPQRRGQKHLLKTSAASPNPRLDASP